MREAAAAKPAVKETEAAPKGEAKAEEKKPQDEVTRLAPGSLMWTTKADKGGGFHRR